MVTRRVVYTEAFDTVPDALNWMHDLTWEFGNDNELYGATNMSASVVCQVKQSNSGQTIHSVKYVAHIGGDLDHKA